MSDYVPVPPVIIPLHCIPIGCTVSDTVLYVLDTLPVLASGHHSRATVSAACSRTFGCLPRLRLSRSGALCPQRGTSPLSRSGLAPRPRARKPLLATSPSCPLASVHVSLTRIAFRRARETSPRLAPARPSSGRPPRLEASSRLRKTSARWVLSCVQGGSSAGERVFFRPCSRGALPSFTRTRF